MDHCQITLINTINLFLNENQKKLNAGGVCSGLVNLYRDHAKEATLPQFFKIIANINKEENSKFISEETSNNIQELYQRIKDSYADSHAVFNEHKKLLKERNYAFTQSTSCNVINYNDLQTPLKKIISETEGDFFIDISSLNHLVTLSRRGGDFYLYDPNLEEGEIKIAEPNDLPLEIFKCFDLLKNDKESMMIKMIPVAYNPNQFKFSENFFLEHLKEIDPSKLNATDALGRSFLNEAVETNNIPAINYLLEKNVKLNPDVRKKFTPIHMAILTEDLESLNLLLNKYHDIAPKIEFSNFNLLEYGIGLSKNKSVINRLCQIDGINKQTVLATYMADCNGNINIGRDMIYELLINGAHADTNLLEKLKTSSFALNMSDDVFETCQVLCHAQANNLSDESILRSLIFINNAIDENTSVGELVRNPNPTKQIKNQPNRTAHSKTNITNVISSHHFDPIDIKPICTEFMKDNRIKAIAANAQLENIIELINSKENRAKPVI